MTETRITPAPTSVMNYVILERTNEAQDRNHTRDARADPMRFVPDHPHPGREGGHFSIACGLRFRRRMEAGG
jgi:hypothetical protein